jgi:hypothetical protein
LDVLQAQQGQGNMVSELLVLARFRRLGMTMSLIADSS